MSYLGFLFGVDISLTFLSILHIFFFLLKGDGGALPPGGKAEILDAHLRLMGKQPLRTGRQRLQIPSSHVS